MCFAVLPWLVVLGALSRSSRDTILVFCLPGEGVVRSPIPELQEIQIVEKEQPA
jgi:hypothetical protein